MADSSSGVFIKKSIMHDSSPFRMWIVNPQGLLRHVTQPLSPALAENRRFEKPRGLTLHVTGVSL